MVPVRRCGNNTILLIVLLGVFVGGSTLLAVEKHVLKSGQEILVETAGPGVVIIQDEEFSYKVLKRNKRLKLISKSSGAGIYVKRYGTTIRIRDLQGHLLHLIKKSGYFYRVKTAMGTILSSMKIESRQAVVENEGIQEPVRVIPEKGKIVFETEQDKSVMVLTGDSRPFPAAFFAMVPLSFPERVACYLMYR